ncbi:MAG: hypothetical protein KatS3mg131_3282 [Candidatus Tectimicrobiota bacterium]|nr:MAG: hypothetical protein KatS3mg131_3282 [Candidatus Tectomicrobia bacterium]
MSRALGAPLLLLGLPGLALASGKVNPLPNMPVIQQYIRALRAYLRDQTL